jgi:hypothetical protein
MFNMVHYNEKKGEKSIKRVSNQVKDSSQKETEHLFEAVLNIHIPFSLIYSLFHYSKQYTQKNPMYNK